MDLRMKSGGVRSSSVSVWRKPYKGAGPPQYSAGALLFVLKVPFCLCLRYPSACACRWAGGGKYGLARHVPVLRTRGRADVAPRDHPRPVHVQPQGGRADCPWRHDQVRLPSPLHPLSLDLRRGKARARDLARDLAHASHLAPVASSWCRVCHPLCPWYTPGVSIVQGSPGVLPELETQAPGL